MTLPEALGFAAVTAARLDRCNAPPPGGYPSPLKRAIARNSAPSTSNGVIPMKASVLFACLVLGVSATSVVIAQDAKAPAAAASAGAVVFDFADMKGVNGVSFVCDSALEPIVGFGGGVTGKITWDPANPKGVSGEISIPTKGLKTPNDGMNGALHGPDWLNAEKNANITFKIKSISEAKPGSNGAVELTAVGDLTLAGVTKEITVPISASYLPGRLGDRMRGAKGDLLILRSNFSVNRSDFGIKAGQIQEVVGEKVDLRVAIAGARKAE